MYNNLKTGLVLTYFLLTISFSNSANILGVFCVNSRSHHSINQPLVRELAARGHNVTIISHFKSESRSPNYTEVLFDGDLMSFVDSIAVDEADKLTGLVAYLKIGRMLEEASCELLLKSNIFRQILISRHRSFDLIITEMYHSQCLTLLGHFLEIPVVGIMPPSTAMGLDIMIGNPRSPATIPQAVNFYSTNMNFYQRMVNTVEYAIVYLAHYTFLNAYMADISKRFFNMDLPSQDVLHKRLAAVFFNNHLSFLPRPAAPNAFDIAGIHIQESKPLPKVRVLKLTAYISLSEYIEHDFVCGGDGVPKVGKCSPTVRQTSLLQDMRLKNDISKC